MAEERGTFAFAIEWLKMMGYHPDTRMSGIIGKYWGWYTADNNWYHYSVSRNMRRFRVDRETLHPAALAAEAWSDLLMNEKLGITAEAESFADYTDWYASANAGMGACLVMAEEPRGYILTDKATFLTFQANGGIIQ